MKREVRFALLTTLALATIGAPWASAQQIYTGVDGRIGFMVYHTLSQVTGNWICTASESSALDTDGSGIIENDECYAYLPPNWNSFGKSCFQVSGHFVNSSIELQGLDGDKPGRRGNTIYHLVGGNNQTQSYNNIPNTGFGRATDTKFLEGDNFVLFECPLNDPNCKNTPPILVNATLRPDNEVCDPDADPDCDRYNWQIKSTNEFPPTYNQLEVWAKLQNVGPTFQHTNVAQTGQLSGATERLFKDAVVVMNRTTTTVPFSSPTQRQWYGPFTQQPAARGWENAMVWYMDNRWCDGFGSGFAGSGGGCPAAAGTPLEARLIDINVERRIFDVMLPDLTNEPDSGHCENAACTLVSKTADAVGFLNFEVDTDRDVLAQNGGLCIDTVNGGVTTCPPTTSPTIPASCASRSNTSAACLPVTGCNCCETIHGCVNTFLRNRSAYVIVDARQALFFPEYNATGTTIVGWTWVKWGKVLSEIPPLHPGIHTRITEVNVATTPSGGQEWQFWQRRPAGGLAPNPLPIAACDQSATSTQVPTPPFTSNTQISSLPSTQVDAWSCNVGTTSRTTLINQGRVLEYGTFNPNDGVITTTAAASDSAMRVPSYTNPHMPTWYGQGITWLAGFLEVKDSSGAVTYRSIAWGGRPQQVCNVANTVLANPGRAVMYEELEWP